MVDSRRHCTFSAACFVYPVLCHDCRKRIDTCAEQRLPRWCSARRPRLWWWHLIECTERFHARWPLLGWQRTQRRVRWWCRIASHLAGNDCRSRTQSTSSTAVPVPSRCATPFRLRFQGPRHHQFTPSVASPRAWPARRHHHAPLAAPCVARSTYIQRGVSFAVARVRETNCHALCTCFSLCELFFPTLTVNRSRHHLACPTSEPHFNPILPKQPRLNTTS